MTYSFTRTREQICTMVLQKLGVLAAGETAASEDSVLVYEALDLRLKEMHRLGIFWRKVTKIPVTFSLTASTNSVSVSADILFPISMKVVNSSQDEPVDIIGVREYAAIPNKAQTGTPTKAIWEGGATFTIWPIPTSNMTGKLVYERIADDTAANTAPDIDVAMMRWVKDIIAADLGDEYGKSEQTMKRWRIDSEIAERNIRKLGAQKVDYAPVAVDDFDDSDPAYRYESDYGR